MSTYATFLQRRLQTQRELIDMLPYIGDLQATFLILRLGAVPRANNLLRTLPPPEALTYYRAQDEQLAGAVCSLLLTQKEVVNTSLLAPCVHYFLPHPCSAEDADVVFASAIRDKRNTYRDLVESNRCEFLVLAAGTGDRWHEDCQSCTASR